jgi:hypothetical protein
VTVDLIVANLLQNAKTAQQAIAEAVGGFRSADMPCKDALATAIITRPENVRAIKELQPIVGKYLKS